MQDAIISAVYLTMRDTFFDKCEYSGLLYQATCSLFEERPKNVRIFLLRPAISRPLLRWTGKQLISNVIQIVVSLSGLKFATGKGMTMRSMAKVPKSYLKGY